MVSFCRTTILSIQIIISLVFLALSNAREHEYFSFGKRKEYINIETIHKCIEHSYETCNEDTFNKFKKIIKVETNHVTIRNNYKSYDSIRVMCILNSEMPLDNCYKHNFESIKSVFDHSNDYLVYRKTFMEKNIELKKCLKKEKRTDKTKCGTSTFVINNMRACTNDAIADFYREVYTNVRGGQAAKTDINQALVSLQQHTIEEKIDLTTGMKFINHLDLLMDRLTFCSEMINKNEAVGI